MVRWFPTLCRHFSLQPYSAACPVHGRRAGVVFQVLRAARAGVAELVDDRKGMLLHLLGDGRDLTLSRVAAHSPEAAPAELADCLCWRLRLHLEDGRLKAMQTA